jgi:hypothetical protein
MKDAIIHRGPPGFHSVDESRALGLGGGKLKAMTAGRRNPKKGGRETEKMQDKLESD